MKNHRSVNEFIISDKIFFNIYINHSQEVESHD